MGVVFFEILFGFCPYEDRTIVRLINQIDTKPLNFPIHINPISKETENMLRQMLIADPKKRIEWKKLLGYLKEEPFVSSLKNKSNDKNSEV